jgi:hypothetical protein
LITVDGLRAQEVFGGLELAMLGDLKRSGIGEKSAERIREKYWRETREARREALMPFFWKTLAPRGVVLGDKECGSRVLLRNSRRFSYPGYAELLTGEACLEVTSNDKNRIQRKTVLEHVAEKLHLEPREVAVFASWDVFPFFAARRPGAVFCNAAHERVPDSFSTAVEARWLNDLQGEALTPWDGVRHDALTVRQALRYLTRYRPRVLYLALDETDDWAHDRRYDRVLDSANHFDEALRRLWTTLQSFDQYRDRTTLVITVDHGRGATLDDWIDHGEDTPGAEEIWLAVIGPDTPDLGVVADAPTVHLADVAATVLGLLGLDPWEFNPHAGPAVPLAFESGLIEVSR